MLKHSLLLASIALAAGAGCGAVEGPQPVDAESAALAWRRPLPFLAPDGTVITVGRDNRGQINDAVGTDTGGVQRHLSISPYFGAPDQTAFTHLVYSENGSTVLDVTLSMSPANEWWGVYAAGGFWQIDYFVSQLASRDPTTLAPVSGHIRNRWTGRVTQLANNWCDFSQNFCPAPALSSYFGSELGRLAYFSSVLQAAASNQQNGAHAALQTGVLVSDIYNIPYCDLNLGFHSGGQKAAGYLMALLAESVTSCGTPDCQLLQWLGGTNGATWQQSGVTVSACGVGSGPNGHPCVRDRNGDCVKE